MIMELLAMNGYGQFVWTAFTFSFVSCLYLYLKTKIEFKKIEDKKKILDLTLLFNMLIIF